MNEGKNNTVMLTIIGIATLLIAVVGATFAYFSAVVEGTDTSKIYVQSGTATASVEGGETITITDIYPRGEMGKLTESDAWVTKTFTFVTTSNVQTNYTLKLITDSVDKFETGDLKVSTVGNMKVYQGEVNAGEVATATPLEKSIAGNILPDNKTEIDMSMLKNGETGLGTGTIVSDGSNTMAHNVVIRIYFPNKNANQNTKQGGTFTAHVALVPETAE